MGCGPCTDGVKGGARGCDGNLAEKGNPLSLPSNTWFGPLSFDGPAMILWDDSLNALQAGPLYISPVDPASRAPATRGALGIDLPRGGIIPRAGNYWFYYNASAAGTFVVQKMCAQPVVVMGGTSDFGYTVAGHVQVTAGAAVSTALVANAQRKYALIQNTGTGNIRVRWDGTDPTAAVGIQLTPGQSITFAGPTLHKRAIRIIRETIDCTVDCVEGA